MRTDRWTLQSSSLWRWGDVDFQLWSWRGNLSCPESPSFLTKSVHFPSDFSPFSFYQFCFGYSWTGKTWDSEEGLHKCCRGIYPTPISLYLSWHLQKQVLKVWLQGVYLAHNDRKHWRGGEDRQGMKGGQLWHISSLSLYLVQIPRGSLQVPRDHLESGSELSHPKVWVLEYEFTNCSWSLTLGSMLTPQHSCPEKALEHSCCVQERV